MNKSEILVNLTVVTNSGATGYFTIKTRVTFICLRQNFINISILQYFHYKYHICIETDALCYSICEVLS